MIKKKNISSLFYFLSLFISQLPRRFIAGTAEATSAGLACLPKRSVGYNNNMVCMQCKSPGLLCIDICCCTLNEPVSFTSAWSQLVGDGEPVIQ